jgi:hypothetical protein
VVTQTRDGDSAKELYDETRSLSNWHTLAIDDGLVPHAASSAASCSQPRSVLAGAHLVDRVAEVHPKLSLDGRPQDFVLFPDGALDALLSA